MAVALEFVNVVIRKAAVERSYLGGLDAFARQDLPNLTEDDHLLRIGFMSGAEAYRFIAELRELGLRPVDPDTDQDVALVWDGSTSPSWLVIGSVGGHWACWASEYPAGELALPEPGFLLRCPRQVYRSLSEAVRRCGAEAFTTTSVAEPGVLARMRCVREGAEITIEAVGESNGDSPVGLLCWRQLARRTQFRADVALIRDIAAILRDAGAEE